MNVVLFGSASTIFTHSYRDVLIDAGHNVLFLNNNSNESDIAVNYKDSVGATSKNYFVKKIIKKINFDKNRIFLNYIERKEIDGELSNSEKLRVKNAVTAFDPEVALFFWGTTLRKEAKYFNSLELNCQRVLIVNTYPVRTRVNTWNENPFVSNDKEYFSIFNKIILPSNYLFKVFNDSGFINNKQKILVNPDFIYTGCIDRKDNSLDLNNNKKMIFLGNTNFSERSIDDISGIIKKLSDEGIDVYLQDSVDARVYLKNKENVFYFNPFNFADIMNGELAKYISKFDGVLYSYGDISQMRYNGSITTRLLLSEGATVPIYIYGQRPDFLNDELISGEFRSFNNFNDLCEKLSLKPLVEGRGLESKYRVEEFLRFFEV